MKKRQYKKETQVETVLMGEKETEKKWRKTQREIDATRGER